MIPGRGAFGLRGRIVGAVLVTTVATLVVAAVALLGPLEHNLRHAEFKAFKTQVSPRVVAGFQNLKLPPDPDLVGLYLEKPPHISSHTRRAEAEQMQAQLTQQQDSAKQHAELVAQAADLAGPLGASQLDVYARLSTGSIVMAARYPAESQPAAGSSYNAAYRALTSAHQPAARYSTVSIDGSEYSQAALSFVIQLPPHEHSRWALVVRRPIVEVNDAVHAVRVAFFDAALAALALTLILAIPLSFTIVRRLRRLRQAALQLAHGRPNVAVPTDRARDEVGDLTRTFGLMQEQLQQQEEARRAFVATASHELRTPLTSLEGMLELLEEDLDCPNPDLDDARSLLARARAQSHRLGRLAADLLDLSRIDAQVALRSEPVELSELARAVMAEFELGTGERGIGSELHDPGTPLWALGDPGSVARILRILLDNALRVSPSGSQIVVELQGGDRAVLSVCDQGPGVPEEEREQIFQRFHRGRNTSGQAGFGLGLAIGRELAERMGGELVLDREYGPGAKFTLRLPVATAPDHDPLVVV